MGELLLASGRKLTGVHNPGTCFLTDCCIHNPSDHPLNDAPMEWMDELRAMFRVCPHGFHHPDPDDLDFMTATFRFVDVEAICSVHLMRESCDGCCR